MTIIVAKYVNTSEPRPKPAIISPEMSPAELSGKALKPSLMGTVYVKPMHRPNPPTKKTAKSLNWVLDTSAAIRVHAMAMLLPIKIKQRDETRSAS